MFNVTDDKSQSPCNIIECCNTEKFRYYGYLAISVFKLISYVVVEGGEIFGWRLDIRRSATLAPVRSY